MDRLFARAQQQAETIVPAFAIAPKCLKCAVFVARSWHCRRKELLCGNIANRTAIHRQIQHHIGPQARPALALSTGPICAQ